MLTAEEKAELLGIARRTIEAYLNERKRPNLTTSSAALSQEGGAFVTLHKGRSLRGCIGTFTSSDPLLETVQHMAIAAATSDPRFPEVTADELPGLHLEISVLSALRRGSADEVEVGVHGIYITSSMRRGVLLPQVAVEHGWDREMFLDHTCIKAGLPPGSWREPGVQIELFTAEVFSE